jgi:periplasmic copper chaperone A
MLMNTTRKVQLMAMTVFLGVSAYGIQNVVHAGGAVTVQNAYAYPTLAGTKNSAAFATITSESDNVIVGAASSQATKVELHSTVVNKKTNSVKMVTLEAMPLPAKKPVSLAPAGNHFMLFDVKKELKIGDTVDMSITLQDGRTIPFKAIVQGRQMKTGLPSVQ